MKKIIVHVPQMIRGIETELVYEFKALQKEQVILFYDDMSQAMVRLSRNSTDSDMTGKLPDDLVGQMKILSKLESVTFVNPQTHLKTLLPDYVRDYATAKALERIS